MPKTVARTVLIAVVLIAAVGCGYSSSAVFNADGSVVVGLKFLFPKSVMNGSAGGSVQGFTPADLTKSNAALAAKYPGAKVVAVTEGDESGAAITVPFKTEKEAFAFMTKPSTLNPAGATGGSSSVDLSNTGGLFVSATHTTNGQADTYTFKTQPAAIPSPSPGSQSPISADELSSILTVTFSLTVPQVITSADGALFTLDRKTAIWTLSWTQPQTLTATTGPTASLAGSVATGALGQSPILPIGVGIVAIIIGFALGKFLPVGRPRSPAAPASGPAFEPTGVAPPTAPPAVEPLSAQPGAWPGPPPGAWPGPPPGMPPPSTPTGGQPPK